MAQNHFSVAGSTSLHEVSPGGRIHIVGVCGVAMAQLAVALTERGYQVSGSDREFYDPMGALLKSSPVTLCKGYKRENVPQDVALVVIANAMFYDNPEVQLVEEKNLPYTSFPQILGEVLIGDRHSIVVCGTHGKSTTTALIASVLHRVGREPSYFIGGMCEDLPKSLCVGEGVVSVVEGDEYHSAFYARVPKFNFYRAKTAIINAIEFDHADIYPQIEDVVFEFRKLIKDVPADGRVICCTDYPLLSALVDEMRDEVQCQLLTFGKGEACDYRLQSRVQKGKEQIVQIVSKELGHVELRIPLMGEYNALNAIATLAALSETGLTAAEVNEHLAHYQSVKRRQQVRYDQKGLVLIEDFAHHPTAVVGTVEAVREAYPQKKLWAVFEPRSNTSRRKVFQKQYESAFDKADEVILAKVTSSSRMNDDVELIDVGELAETIDGSGTHCRAIPTTTEIEEILLAEVGHNDVIVLMSNGSFGGLPASLQAALEKRD